MPMAGACDTGSRAQPATGCAGQGRFSKVRGVDDHGVVTIKGQTKRAQAGAAEGCDAHRWQRREGAF